MRRARKILLVIAGVAVLVVLGIGLMFGPTGKIEAGEDPVTTTVHR